MKAKHRHELKTNELAEWIANFPQWFKSNLRTIIYASIIVVLIGGSYLYHSYQKNVVALQERLRFTSLVRQLQQLKTRVIREQMQGRDMSFAFLQVGNELADFADSTKNNNMAALGLIKHAEAIRMELHYRFDTVSNQETAAQIAKAKSSYSRAIEKLSKDPEGLKSLLATAKLGLGLCEEEIRSFSKAEDIYRDITEDNSLEGTTAVVAAKIRLETMTDYQKKVAFRPPAKKVSPKPAQIQLEGSSFTNLPQNVNPKQVIPQPAEANLSDKLQ